MKKIAEILGKGLSNSSGAGRKAALLALFVLITTVLSLQEIRAQNTFLAPPGIPWGNVARIDVDGDGIPEATDEAIGGSRNGTGLTLVSTRFRPRSPGQATLELSTIQAGTGRFLTSTASYRDAFGRLHVITSTVGGFDANSRLTNLVISERGGARAHLFTLTLVDSNKDGIYEGLTVDGDTRPKTTLSLVTVSVDGKPAFITIPWALANILGVDPRARVPQVFIPLGDTNGDGVADSVAFDFNGDGKPDPDLQVGPAVALSPAVAEPTADLSVTKGDAPDPIIAGNRLTYVSVVTNKGPAPATGVTFTDPLPAGVNFISAASTQGTCSQAAGTVTCNIGTLNNGASATVTIVASPSKEGTVTNTARVAAAEKDPNTANNSASAETKVLDPMLYFAQFGDGAISSTERDGRPVTQQGRIFSEIMLFNLDIFETAKAKISLRDSAGNALGVDLNGEMVLGEKELTIPPGGLRVLRTDGRGPVTVGSVAVHTDRAVGGVVLFGGSFGLAGVGNSAELARGFVTPVESDSSQGISSAIAVMSLEARDVVLELELSNADGTVVSRARLDGVSALKAGGQVARFLQEFNWNPSVDFSNFTGLLKVTSSGKVAATVLQTQPGELATLPVASVEASSARDQSLRFAQFGDGELFGAQLFSKLTLFHLSSQPVNARVSIRDDPGRPMSVDLNGEVVQGRKDLLIPPGGLRVLRTDGRGLLAGGSVTVDSDKPLAGSVLFGGTLGAAGIGNNEVLTDGFVAPMESNSALGISTGIAIMNLETTDVTVDLQLTDAEGRLVASARLEGANALKVNGRFARFLPEFNWSPAVDFSNFTGLLTVSSSGRIAATVLQTRPGQFATLPVEPR